MLRALEESASASQDDLTGDPIPLALTTGCGQPGRPRIQIDKQWLAYANQGMTTKDIAKAVGCAPRTVRRYLILYGLSEPAPPVIQHVERPDGTYAKEWHPTGPTRSAIRNDPERLDGMVKKILDRFPNYSLNFVRASCLSRPHPYIPDKGARAPATLHQSTYREAHILGTGSQLPVASRR